MLEWLISRLLICYFRLCLKMVCSRKKWLMLEIIDNNAFEIMTLSNNLELIFRLKDHNIVFCSHCMIREICVFC